MRIHRALSLAVSFSCLSSFIFLRNLESYFRAEIGTAIVSQAERANDNSQLVKPEDSIELQNSSFLEHVFNSSGQLCPREEIKVGSWVPVTLQEPPYISRTSHLRCYPLQEYKKGYWNTYDWKPASNCEFTKWNRQQFCSLLKQATILIVGDSLSWEHYASLAQLLGLKVLQSAQHVSKAQRRNHIQLACQNKVRLVFRRDDLLTNLTDVLESTHPQILIVNRGAHYVNDTRLLPAIQRNLEEIKAWQAKCDRMKTKCHFFWRTSVPGHPRCDKVDFKKPINNLQEMEEWIGDHSNYNNHTIKYHWYDYQHQNNLVLDLLGRTMEHEYDVLDAYHLNLLRPDEHRAHENDCKLNLTTIRLVV
jgi:hypothetical protein